MNRPFQRRLSKVEQGVEKLLMSAYTDAENREWAEQQLVEMMAEFNLTCDEALAQAKQHAPTIAEWVMQRIR